MKILTKGTGSVDYLGDLGYEFWRETSLLSFFKFIFLGALSTTSRMPSRSIIFERRQNISTGNLSETHQPTPKKKKKNLNRYIALHLRGEIRFWGELSF